MRGERAGARGTRPAEPQPTPAPQENTPDTEAQHTPAVEFIAQPIEVPQNQSFDALVQRTPDRPFTDEERPKRVQFQEGYGSKVFAALVNEKAFHVGTDSEGNPTVHFQWDRSDHPDGFRQGEVYRVRIHDDSFNGFTADAEAGFEIVPIVGRPPRDGSTFSKILYHGDLMRLVSKGYISPVETVNVAPHEPEDDDAPEAEAPAGPSDTPPAETPEPPQPNPRDFSEAILDNFPDGEAPDDDDVPAPRVAPAKPAPVPPVAQAEPESAPSVFVENAEGETLPPLEDNEIDEEDASIEGGEKSLEKELNTELRLAAQFLERMDKIAEGVTVDPSTGKIGHSMPSFSEALPQRAADQYEEKYRALLQRFQEKNERYVERAKQDPLILDVCIIHGCVVLTYDSSKGMPLSVKTELPRRTDRGAYATTQNDYLGVAVIDINKGNRKSGVEPTTTAIHELQHHNLAMSDYLVSVSDFEFPSGNRFGRLSYIYERDERMYNHEAQQKDQAKYEVLLGRPMENFRADIQTVVLQSRYLDELHSSFMQRKPDWFSKEGTVYSTRAEGKHWEIVGDHPDDQESARKMLYYLQALFAIDAIANNTDTGPGASEAQKKFYTDAKKAFAKAGSLIGVARTVRQAEQMVQQEWENILAAYPKIRTSGSFQYFVTEWGKSGVVFDDFAEVVLAGAPEQPAADPQFEETTDAQATQVIDLTQADDVEEESQPAEQKSLCVFESPQDWLADEEQLRNGDMLQTAVDPDGKHFMLGSAFEGKGDDGLALEMLPDGDVIFILADGTSGSAYQQELVKLVTPIALEGLRNGKTIEEVNAAVLHAIEQPLPQTGKTLKETLDTELEEIAEYFRTSDPDDPGRVEKAKRHMWLTEKGGKDKILASSTCIIAHYDKSKGMLRAALAGDSTLYIHRAAGGVESYTDTQDSQIAYRPDGKSQGNFQIVEVQLSPGDRFFAASDGFTNPQMEKAMQASDTLAELEQLVGNLAITDDVSAIGITVE